MPVRYSNPRQGRVVARQAEMGLPLITDRNFQVGVRHETSPVVLDVKVSPFDACDGVRGPSCGVSLPCRRPTEEEKAVFVTTIFQVDGRPICEFKTGNMDNSPMVGVGRPPSVVDGGWESQSHPHSCFKVDVVQREGRSFG